MRCYCQGHNEDHSSNGPQGKTIPYEGAVDGDFSKSSHVYIFLFFYFIICELSKNMEKQVKTPDTFKNQS